MFIYVDNSKYKKFYIYEFICTKKIIIKYYSKYSVLCIRFYMYKKKYNNGLISTRSCLVIVFQILLVQR